MSSRKRLVPNDPKFKCKLDKQITLYPTLTS